MGANSRLGVLLDDGGTTFLRYALVVSIATGAAIFAVAAVPAVLLVAAFGGAGIVHPPAPAVPSVRPVVPSPHGEQPTGELPPVGAPPGAASAVDVARRYLGVAYLFGGTNPAVGLDCSGLVQLVYHQIGLSLPRTAQQQYDATLRIAGADLQPGDLVFYARTYPDPHDWITHVGIYIGGGLQINAPTEGQVVSVQPVFSGYWGEHFASGGRLRGNS